MKERWSSKIGFILAAIGSAVGIGNIWRFSAVVGQNGGGAYLIPYLCAVFLCAMPLMILELAVGRHFRATVVSAFRNVRPVFRVIGWLMAAVVFLILSYYLVITGWTIGYILFSATGQMETFSAFTGSYQPVVFFVLSAIATGVTVAVGVKKGIEKLSTLMIPLCVLVLSGIAIYGITLPGFGEGMAFFLTPDFTVLTRPVIWSAAFGQAFFSLSVGEGILITYGAYTQKEAHIVPSAAIVTITDIGVAMLAGAVIFPVVYSSGLAPTIGAELAFSTLPKAFAIIPGGQILATLFFSVLFFAALTSAISMFEVNVAAVREASGWSRHRTAALLTGVVVLVGMPSALSYSAADLTVGGVRVLDFMDETVGTLGLPVAALLTTVVFTWFIDRKILESQIDEDRRYSLLIHPLCKYVIPTVLVVSTATRLLSGVDIQATKFIPGTEFIGTLAQGAGTIALFAVLIAAIAILCRFRGCGRPAWLTRR